MVLHIRKLIGMCYHQVVDEEEPWELVRDTIKDQEKETVESWKDELNYLLVFVRVPST